MDKPAIEAFVAQFLKEISESIVLTIYIGEQCGVWDGKHPGKETVYTFEVSANASRTLATDVEHYVRVFQVALRDTFEQASVPWNATQVRYMV